MKNSGLKIKSNLKAGAGTHPYADTVCATQKGAFEGARLDYNEGKITRADYVAKMREYQQCLNGL